VYNYIYIYIYIYIYVLPLRHSRCLGHGADEGPPVPGVSDLVLCTKLGHLPVLIDTACRSSFHHPPDRPNFRRTDWANFQTHLEDQIPLDPELHNGMAIDTSVHNFSGAVLKALAASTPKCRPRDDPRSLIPTGIQDEIRLKNWLRRRWQVTRDPALKAEVNRLQRSVTYRHEWRNDQWSATLESLDHEDQSLWRMTKRVMRVPTPSPPSLPQGESLSQILRKPKPLPTIRRLSFSR
jgi:hypothetical protein